MDAHRFQIARRAGALGALGVLVALFVGSGCSETPAPSEAPSPPDADTLAPPDTLVPPDTLAPPDTLPPPWPPRVFLPDTTWGGRGESSQRHFFSRRLFTIDNQDSLERFWQISFRDQDRPARPSIDFGTHELLVVAGGVLATACTGVTIDSLVQGPDSCRVYSKLTSYDTTGCSYCGASPSAPWSATVIPKYPVPLLLSIRRVILYCR
jgi:hypothetical protein